MSSQLKRDSARANGAKSHGPATPEGLAKSSHNSLRHGLAAKSVVLPHEDAAQFELLLEAHIEQFHPRTAVEMDLVETMAAARWRLRRICALETALFSTELERHKEDMGPEYETGEERLAWVFKRLAENSKSLAMLGRYEATLNRSYDRALKQLLLLQRQNEPKPAPTELEPDRVTSVEPATSRSQPSSPASPESYDPSGFRTVDPRPGTST